MMSPWHIPIDPKTYHWLVVIHSHILSFNHYIFMISLWLVVISPSFRGHTLYVALSVPKETPFQVVAPSESVAGLANALPGLCQVLQGRVEPCGAMWSLPHQCLINVLNGTVCDCYSPIQLSSDCVIYYNVIQYCIIIYIYIISSINPTPSLLMFTNLPVVWSHCVGFQQTKQVM
jgi:hypothetical protein